MSVVWLWSGAVTPSGARVRAKVTGTSTRLAVADNAGMSGPVFFGPVVPVNGGIATLDATGLDPDTQYWYRLEDNGVIDTSKTGRFHTHGVVGSPYSHTVVVGGDAGLTPVYPGATGTELAPSRISNHPVFETIRQLDPLLYICLGDRLYYNFGDGAFVPDASVATFRTSYDDMFLQPNQAGLYRDVPIVYINDDHDGGPNDWNGTFVSKANGVQVYRERVPSYPLAQGSGALYHSYQVGRVLYAVTDGRYNRDAPTAPAPRAYLGATQVAWLDNLLATTSAEWLIWVSPQPPNSPGATSWASYPEERNQIYQLFGDHGFIGRMACVAGDQHWIGFDTGTNTAGFPLWTLTPLDATPTNGSGGSYDLGVAVTSARGQYGTVDVVDAGTYIQVTGRGWRRSV